MSEGFALKNVNKHILKQIKDLLKLKTFDAIFM